MPQTPVTNSAQYDVLCLERIDGFTLIELLVAMFITALIGVMAMSSFSSALKAIDGIEHKAQQLTQLNNFFIRFERDITHALPSTTSNTVANSMFSYTNKGTENSLSFNNNTRINPAPETFARSAVQRISYIFEDEKIIRKRWSQTQPDSDEKNTEILMLENVEKLSYRFIAPQLPVGVGSSNQLRSADGLRWIDTWPDPALSFNRDQANAQGTLNPALMLPVAIEISIELKPWGSITRIFSLAGS